MGYNVHTGARLGTRLRGTPFLQFPQTAGGQDMNQEFIAQTCRLGMGRFLARLGLLTQYADELSQLRESCAQHMDTLSPRLQRAGEALLQRYVGPWQGVDWLQPLVLSETWSVPLPSRQIIATANALTAMHAHIQRAAMNDDSRQSGAMLPLSSWLYTHALYQYQRLFPPTSFFWRLLEGYHLEWAESVLWERQRQWGAVKQYSQEDTLRLAGVGALLKVSTAAVALATGNQRSVMPLSSIMDQIHIGIQLMDGIVSWREDLRTRKATYFLTEVALALNAQEMASLGRLDLQEFLAISQLPSKVTKQALKHLSAAEKVTSRLKAPVLMTYIDNLRTACQEIPRQWNLDLANSHTPLERATVSATP